MINSLTRPLFYDENGRLQKVGEKVWDISRHEISYITIKCPYKKGDGTVVPEITENDFFIPSSVIVEYNEYEDDSVQVIFIQIKRSSTFAYKYWTANWDEITFKNCAQHLDYYSKTMVESDKITITAEVNEYSASVDGYVSIVIPDVHSTVLSTPGIASQEACAFSFGCGVQGNFYGTFNGNLSGLAHRASYTSSGSLIGARWYYTVVQIKCQDITTGGYWYITFTLPLFEEYRFTSPTVKDIYNAWRDMGFLYDTTTSEDKKYQPMAIPVSVTDPVKNNNTVSRIYSGMAYATKQPRENGYFQGFIISYMDGTSVKEFELPINGGTIVYFNQHHF